MCVCVYVYIFIHTHTHTRKTVSRLNMNYCCYQITLQVKYFYTKWEQCEVLTGYLSLGQWRGEYMTLDNILYNIHFKQEVIAAPVTSLFSSLSHSSTEPLLET